MDEIDPVDGLKLAAAAINKNDRGGWTEEGRKKSKHGWEDVRSAKLTAVKSARYMQRRSGGGCSSVCTLAERPFLRARASEGWLHPPSQRAGNRTGSNLALAPLWRGGRAPKDI